MNGISIPFIKVKIPQSALLLTALALAGGYYVGSKYIFGKGSGLYGNSPTAYAVRAYAADTNLPFMRHRVVNLMMRNAADRNTVIENMDRLLQIIGGQEYRLKALADERASGAITPTEFRAKLFEIVKMIATEMGISLVPQTRPPNRTNDRMASMIEMAQTGRMPNNVKSDYLISRGYGVRRMSIGESRAKERRDFYRRIHGFGQMSV